MALGIVWSEDWRTSETETELEEHGEESPSSSSVCSWPVVDHVLSGREYWQGEVSRSAGKCPAYTLHIGDAVTRELLGYTETLEQRYLPPLLLNPG